MIKDQYPTFRKTIILGMRKSACLASESIEVP